MNYRRLGRTGLKVSEISLGSWLTYAGYVDEKKSRNIIHEAYESGVNFFDTANVYMQGEAEKIVGKALKQYPRDRYVLSTKVYFPMGDGPNDRGLSRKHIMDQCHASLKRLGVDYLDIYYCHRYDPETPVDETLRAFDDLIRQGKILYAGVSEWSAPQITEAIRIADQYTLDKIVVNQPRYNMFQRYIEDDVIPTATKYGVGQVVFSPLAQGVLTGKYKRGEKLPENSRAMDPQGKRFVQRFLNEENLIKVEKLQELADDEGITLVQLALAWVLRLPSVSSAIVGASKPSHIRDNVTASGITLSEETIEKVKMILTMA
ncbi:MAG TPA: aldo/keto reductase family protein [Balneolales bacterium]|nr:aldo/keto reductase family protein [Balneolales bacterium]